MFTKIRNFHAIVECGSFTEAALHQNISQSAISQQMQTLENEVGVKLFNREKRKISLTPAGEVFYRKSMVLLAEYEQMLREVQKAEHKEEYVLRVGVSSLYGTDELQLAISRFSEKYPDMEIETVMGNHEKLFRDLRDGLIDVSLTDQRRAFSNSACNIVVKTQKVFVEIAKSNPLARLDRLTPEDLKELPCILVADEKEEFNEHQYYATVYDVMSECVYARSIKDARLMVVSNRGYFLVDGTPVMSHFSETIARVPFYKGPEQFEKNLCVFYLKENSGYYVEDFTEMLCSEFKKTDRKQYA